MATKRTWTVKKSSNAAVYQLKITLQASHPPIWRRALVSADITLHQLHDTIQLLMGWSNSHLHQFIAAGVVYGEDDPEFGLGDEAEFVSEHKVVLQQLLRQEKDKLIYEYDFGDSWEHKVVLEKILPPDPPGSYPICLTGKRACPPEDVGGMWGYDSFLEAIGDPENPEHEDMLEWAGAFDPEEFDLQEINKRLDRLR